MSRAHVSVSVCECYVRVVKLEIQEDAKLLRKRNIKVFSDILDNMPSLTYCTSWSETQQMLLDNPQFTEDPDLQSNHYTVYHEHNCV